MRWSTCKSCKIGIDHQYGATRLLIRRYRFDYHPATPASKYTFQICLDCTEKIYELMPDIRPKV